MIIVKIFGGLGNQLFQYAMARSVAYRNNVEFKVDLSWFLNDRVETPRKFSLDKFNVKYSLANDNEVNKYLTLKKIMGRDLYETMIPFKYKKYIRQREFQNFNNKYMNMRGNVYLDGYWTDERYFTDVTQFIRKEFALQNELSPMNKEISDIIQDTESVSIHVRRGDYVTSKNFEPIFNICNEQYYKQAVSEIVKRIAKPNFFIFSDDIEWARQNVKTGHNTVYVSGLDGGLPHEELILMSTCKHNVIANSTFSWWSAWLNSNTGKIVIAPGKWFNLSAQHGGECVPSTWYKIAV